MKHRSNARGVVFNYYNQGLKPAEVQLLTKYDYSYIDKLFFDWDMQKVKDKYAGKNEPSSEIEVFAPPNNSFTNSFVLITTNHEVREAEYNMLHRKNTIIQW